MPREPHRAAAALPPQEPDPPSASPPTFADVVRSVRRHYGDAPGFAARFHGAGVGAEDVDRQEQLDELDPTFAPVPWRSLRSNRNPFDTDHPADRPVRLGRNTAQEFEEGRRQFIEETFAPLVSLDELLGNPSVSNQAAENNGSGGALPEVVERAQRDDSPTEGEETAWISNLSIPVNDSDAPSASARRRRRRLQSVRGPLSGSSGPLQFASRSGTISSDEEESGDDIEMDLDDDVTFRLARFGPPEMHRSTGLYGLRNRTQEDLTVLGGSGGGVSLRRGMFNGRRRSIIDRLRDLDSVRPVPGVVEPMPRETVEVQRSGLEPTNAAVQNRSPIFVGSPDDNGRRHRSEGEKDANQRSAKRRKVTTQREDDTKPLLFPTTRPSYLQCTTLDPDTPLPTTFEQPKRMSCVSLSAHVSPEHQRPCITFTYSPLPHGPSDDDYASALRGDVPVPPECGVYYYEAEVLDAGESGYMSVGWMRKENRLNRLVGWDKGSYGWHGDDGRSFAGRASGEPFAEQWTSTSGFLLPEPSTNESEGDVVGCGIDFTTGKGFFTKNGKMMGE